MSTDIHHTRDGRRFAYVGDYTVRETAAATFDVLRDVDGDDVLIASNLPTIAEAIVCAKLAEFSGVQS